MTSTEVYITGMGVITSLGAGVTKTKNAIRKGLKGLRPLSLFSIPANQSHPVGEVPLPLKTDDVPRTHQLARLAADQAMAVCKGAPDAVVIGVTTGGMSTTETLLRNGANDPNLFRYQAVGSVAEDIACRYQCTGPVITVSTACSSGTVAVKIGMEMLRCGLAERVLVGGADSLCRLTYYGFHSLKLIDPDGARPLDKNRQGMSVGEGAAMLLLETRDKGNAVAEVLGVGLSCDAHHPVKPHPQGKGALAAMKSAIRDAGISISNIDYINLHGTGTPDNDLSEAHALCTLFPGKKPLLSSVKGALGHSLAAAGAIEAVVSAISVSDNLAPVNVGCRVPDPALKLEPLLQQPDALIDCVLSNSFGFGGNNAAIIIGAPGKFKRANSSKKIEPLSVLGCACVTGAGFTEKTMENISMGKVCKGRLSIQEISGDLPHRTVRRLKRLPRLALCLADRALEKSGGNDAPSSIFFGTAWGALSETYDFLTGLFETDDQFPSPTDFIGSVHNAPGGQIAMQFQSTGANITTTGGDCSFEQSLLAAHLLADDDGTSFFVLGADESHGVLSKLFDRSVLADGVLSDGGGAFCLKKGNDTSGITIHLSFFENRQNNPEVISSLISRLGGPERIKDLYGVILAGIPGGYRREGEKQLQTFLSLSGFRNPVIDYRKIIGEFGAASAVAGVLALKFVEDGKIPGSSWNGHTCHLNGKGALVIGLGDFITAVEVLKR